MRDKLEHVLRRLWGEHCRVDRGARQPLHLLLYPGGGHRGGRDTGVHGEDRLPHLIHGSCTIDRWHQGPPEAAEVMC